MAHYELAQLNIARLTAPIDSPSLADFVANLDRINALAEQSAGFVWRLQTDEGNSTGIRDFGDEYIVNMSVWTDIESLHNYVYRSGHVEIMRRRKEWFAHMREAYSVLWWCIAGQRPTVGEAKARLEQLRAMGPSAQAFIFKKPFAPPGQAESASAGRFDDSYPTSA